MPIASKYLEMKLKMKTVAVKMKQLSLENLLS